MPSQSLINALEPGLYSNFRFSKIVVDMDDNDVNGDDCNNDDVDDVDNVNNDDVDNECNDDDVDFSTVCSPPEFHFSCSNQHLAVIVNWTLGKKIVLGFSQIVAVNNKLKHFGAFILERWLTASVQKIGRRPDF